MVKVHTSIVTPPPPLDGKLVHRRVTPQHLYTWVGRDKVQLSSLSKETTRRARLEPWTSRSGVRGVNRSATHASSSRKKKVNCKRF